MRPLGAGAVVFVEREERRGCSWNGEIVVERDRDARSCRCAQPDLAIPVARAARQFPGQRGQVSHLLRHPGRHDLRGVSGQTVLERRTSRGVSSVLFFFFSSPPPSLPSLFNSPRTSMEEHYRSNFSILGKIARNSFRRPTSTSRLRQKCSVSIEFHLLLEYIILPLARSIRSFIIDFHKSKISVRIILSNLRTTPCSLEFSRNSHRGLSK